MSDKEGNGNSITVHDDADLTTLVGRGGKYEKLVKNCFTNEDDGNVTWDEAKTFSMEGFLSTFAAENPARRASLQGWIKHYGLKNRFEKEVPKDGKPPCRFVALWFLYDSVGGSGAIEKMTPFTEQPIGVPCVISSSPKDTNYKQGIKNMRGGPGG